MKIVSSTVAMEGRSSHISEETQVSSLRMWDNRSKTQTGTNSSNSILGDRLNLSSNGLFLAQIQAQAQAGSEELSTSLLPPPVSPASAVEDPDKINPEDALSDKDLMKIRLLEKMIEGLTGKKFKFKYYAFKDFEKALATKPLNLPNAVAAAHSQRPQPQAPATLGWGVHFHEETTQSLKETVDFQSKGSVVTADGTAIDFQLNYHFSQEISSSTIIDFKAGDALIDPLVIRLDDSPLQFSKDPIQFDLDIDGLKDSFRVPIDQAGLLFLDQNGNQVADNGSELFGPTTGQGFAELKALDSDQNGWIDEGDSAFDNLRIWVRSNDGTDRYIGLIEAGVGALFVESANTEAGLYSQDAALLGQMKMTSFYLKESGQPGLVHELDFKI